MYTNRFTKIVVATIVIAVALVTASMLPAGSAPSNSETAHVQYLNGEKAMYGPGERYGVLPDQIAWLIAEQIQREYILGERYGVTPQQYAPEAGVQSVTDYLRVHSNPSAQAVPDASVQSVMNYIRLHSTSTFINAQAVPDPAVQSVTDYIRLHSNDKSTPLITNPAAQSALLTWRQGEKDVK